MPDTSRPTGPLVFGDFLAYLQRQGFVIGVDHHLRLQQLLVRLGDQCAPHELKLLLCPLFATSAQEQALFCRAFTNYFTLFHTAPPWLDEPSGAAEPDAASPEATAAVPAKPVRWRSQLLWTVLTVITLTGAALFIPAVWRALNPIPPTPTVTPIADPSPIISASPASSPSVTATETTTVTPDPVPVTPSPNPTPTPTLAPWPRVRAWAYAQRQPLRALAVILPVVGFLLLEARRRRQQQLLLERVQGRELPLTWPVRVTAPELKFYRNEQFYRAARGLRRRQVGEFERLDVARSITATIAAQGYPNFRYRPDSRVPEYLLLIDRAAAQDHQARLFDTLAQALEREGLFLVRYFYDGDPRICRTGADTGDIHLTELQKRYPAHRLLLFGDGERLLDPLSGAFASWAALLLEWPERALLTPISRATWGWREKVRTPTYQTKPG
jgi:hypothetical protein